MIDPELKNFWAEAGANPQFMQYDPTYGRIRLRIEPGIPSFMETPIAWKPEDLPGADVVFLGYGFEGPQHLSPAVWATIGDHKADPSAIMGREGNYDAPNYLRSWSIHYSIHVSGGFFPEVSPDFRLVDHLVIKDYRNIECDPADVEETAKRAYQKVSDIVKAGAIPLVIGGDHSIPYPIVKAINDHSKGKIGIICFDAHYDNSYGGPQPEPYKEFERLNGGIQFYKIFDECDANPENMVLIGIKGGAYNTPLMHEVAKKAGYTIFNIRDVEHVGMKEVIQRAVEAASRGTDRIYVSLDVDSMDPVYFPAQVFPDPFGLSGPAVKEALEYISLNTNLCGFDINGIGPAYDHMGLSGLTGCRFFIELMKGMAIRKTAKK